MSRLTDVLSKVSIGQPQIHEQVSIYPVIVPNGHPRGYQTLDEALAAKTLEVKEVSEGGSVPNLLVNNTGVLPVLLVIGEELIGAKQNRVLNTSLLIPAQKEMAIPVSCVEHGRWGYSSRFFSSEGTSSHYMLRKMQTEKVTESLRARGLHDADQHAVWDEVSRISTRTQSFSTTGALHAMYEQHSGRLQSYLDAFQMPDAQGMVVVVNGEVIGADLFDHTETFRHQWNKLLRSYVINAMDRRDRPAETPLRDTQAFIAAAQQAKEENYSAVGIGEDVRLTSDLVTGSGLVWEDHVVHASLFNAHMKPYFD
jgi:hypothetical protein